MMVYAKYLTKSFFEQIMRSISIRFLAPLVLWIGAGSCQFLIPSLRRYYNDYQVINRTGSAITVMAYSKSSVVDGFIIRSGQFHRAFIDERDNPIIFHSEYPDSVVVTHENSQKHIIDYCGGRILDGDCGSQDIKSIARMGTATEHVAVQRIRKKEGDRHISNRYTLILEEEDFK